MCLYVGFVSYMVFLSFFEFLGSAVNRLNYWGSKEGASLLPKYHVISPHGSVFYTTN